MSHARPRDVYVLSGRPMASLLYFRCASVLCHWCSAVVLEDSSLVIRSAHSQSALMDSYTPFTPANTAPDMHYDQAKMGLRPRGGRGRKMTTTPSRRFEKICYRTFLENNTPSTMVRIGALLRRQCGECAGSFRFAHIQAVGEI